MNAVNFLEIDNSHLSQEINTLYEYIKSYYSPHDLNQLGRTEFMSKLNILLKMDQKAILRFLRLSSIFPGGTDFSLDFDVLRFLTDVIRFQWKHMIGQIPIIEAIFDLYKTLHSTRTVDHPNFTQLCGLVDEIFATIVSDRIQMKGYLNFVRDSDHAVDIRDPWYPAYLVFKNISDFLCDGSRLFVKLCRSVFTVLSQCSNLALYKDLPVGDVRREVYKYFSLMFFSAVPTSKFSAEVGNNLLFFVETLSFLDLSDLWGFDDEFKSEVTDLVRTASNWIEHESSLECLVILARIDWFLVEPFLSVIIKQCFLNSSNEMFSKLTESVFHSRMSTKFVERIIDVLYKTGLTFQWYSVEKFINKCVVCLTFGTFYQFLVKIVENINSRLRTKPEKSVGLLQFLTYLIVHCDAWYSDCLQSQRKSDLFKLFSTILDLLANNGLGETVNNGLLLLVDSVIRVTAETIKFESSFPGNLNSLSLFDMSMFFSIFCSDETSRVANDFISRNTTSEHICSLISRKVKFLSSVALSPPGIRSTVESGDLSPIIAECYDFLRQNMDSNTFVGFLMENIVLAINFMDSERIRAFSRSAVHLLNIHGKCCHVANFLNSAYFSELSCLWDHFVVSSLDEVVILHKNSTKRGCGGGLLTEMYLSGDNSIYKINGGVLNYGKFLFVVSSLPVKVLADIRRNSLVGVICQILVNSKKAALLECQDRFDSLLSEFVSVDQQNFIPALIFSNSLFFKKVLKDQLLLPKTLSLLRFPESIPVWIPKFVDKLLAKLPNASPPQTAGKFKVIFQLASFFLGFSDNSLNVDETPFPEFLSACQKVSTVVGDVVHELSVRNDGLFEYPELVDLVLCLMNISNSTKKVTSSLKRVIFVYYEELKCHATVYYSGTNGDQLRRLVLWLKAMGDCRDLINSKCCLADQNWLYFCLTEFLSLLSRRRNLMGEYYFSFPLMSDQFILHVLKLYVGAQNKSSFGGFVSFVLDKLNDPHLHSGACSVLALLLETDLSPILRRLLMKDFFNLIQKLGDNVVSLKTKTDRLPFLSCLNMVAYLMQLKNVPAFDVSQMELVFKLFTPFPFEDDFDVFDGYCRLLNVILLRHYSHFDRFKSTIFLVISELLQYLMVYSSKSSSDPLNSAELFARLVSHLDNFKGRVALDVTSIIVKYMNAEVSTCIKDILMRVIYQLMQLCGPKYLRMILNVEDDSNKCLLKAIHSDFVEFHKFTGHV